MQTTMRAFDVKDYPAVVDVFNASWPGYPTTSEELCAQDQATHNHRASKFQRYVAEHNGDIIAFGYYDQPPRFYEPGRLRTAIHVHPQYQGHGVGSKLYELLMQDVLALHTRSIWTKLREDMLSGIQFARRHDFYEELCIWELYLDLATFDPIPYTELLPFLKREQGIEIRTLQQLKTTADCYQKLYDLTCAVGQDLPLTEHWAPPSYADFLRDIQSRSPELYYIAVHEDSYVGLSYLTARKEGNHCGTGLTGVKRSYRRKGIALALKLRGIIDAKLHGYLTITTSVDSSNLASLSMNRRLGFTERLSWIVFVKEFASL